MLVHHYASLRSFVLFTVYNGGIYSLNATDTQLIMWVFKIIIPPVLKLGEKTHVGQNDVYQADKHKVSMFSYQNWQYNATFNPIILITIQLQKRFW